MKTTGVKDIPKFGLLVFMGHPIAPARFTEKQIADVREAFAYFDLLQIFHVSHLPEFRPGLK